MRHVTLNCFKTKHRAHIRLRYIQKRLLKKLYQVPQLIRRTKNLVHPQRSQVNLKCTIIRKIIALKTEVVQLEIYLHLLVHIDRHLHVLHHHIDHHRLFRLPNHQNLKTSQVVTRIRTELCRLSRFRNSARLIQVESSMYNIYYILNNLFRGIVMSVYVTAKR